MTNDFKRLKYFRKIVLSKTQTIFSNETGISRSALAAYETGITRIPDVLIKLMVEKYFLNEDWLRTGRGSPQLYSLHKTSDTPLCREDIVKYERLEANIKELLKEKDVFDVKVKELEEALSRLDKEERNLLLESFIKIAHAKT